MRDKTLGAFVRLDLSKICKQSLLLCLSNCGLRSSWVSRALPGGPQVPSTAPNGTQFPNVFALPVGPQELGTLVLDSNLLSHEAYCVLSQHYLPHWVTVISTRRLVGRMCLCLLNISLQDISRSILGESTQKATLVLLSGRCVNHAA